ncbi:hypothetical protein C8J57DRAFT_1271043, partial [Mycena rebaudengoi]
MSSPDGAFEGLAAAFSPSTSTSAFLSLHLNRIQDHRPRRRTILLRAPPSPSRLAARGRHRVPHEPRGRARVRPRRRVRTCPMGIMTTPLLLTIPVLTSIPVRLTRPYTGRSSPLSRRRRPPPTKFAFVFGSGGV